MRNDKTKYRLAVKGAIFNVTLQTGLRIGPCIIASPESYKACYIAKIK